MAYSKEVQARTNSAPRRCGASASGCFSCTINKTDLLRAIEMHQSPPFTSSHFHAHLRQFFSETEKQDILNFLHFSL